MRRAPYFLSTIGRKQSMAITGLGLSLFVLMHAAGNLLIFAGPEAYNKYSLMIISNPLLYVAEAGLVAMFVSHAIAAIMLTLRNFAARPKGYARAACGDKATSATTKTMWVQGAILLGFTGLHLNTFKYGSYYETQVAGVAARDLFRLANEVFQSSGYLIGYVFALIVLCFHVGHGLQSSLQTLGFHHPRFTKKIKCVSALYGALVTAAFVAPPVYLHFFYKG